MPSKRRPKGEGSVTVLPSGKVRVRVELEPVDGKRQWLSATADTKREAVEKLKKLQREKEDSVLRLKAAEDTIDYQLEVYKQHLRALKRSGTVLRQTTYAANDMKETIHDISLSRITSQHMDTLLLKWHEKGLEQSTIDIYVSKLKSFFDWCVLEDKIRKNPLLGYKFKGKKKKTKQQMLILSNEEHEQIKAYFYTWWERKRRPIKKWSLKFRMYALYCLAYETGMRVSEIAALKWEDVHFEDNKVRVLSTISTAEDGKRIVKAPKTDSGFRDIIISEKTKQLLEDVKDFSGELSEYVFYNHKTHTHYWGTAIYDAFERALEKIGIERPITFHDIRHTNASNMIYKNVPIAVITERLGHSSIAVTYSTYGHIIRECQEAQTAVIEA